MDANLSPSPAAFDYDFGALADNDNELTNAYHDMMSVHLSCLSRSLAESSNAQAGNVRISVSETNLCLGYVQVPFLAYHRVDPGPYE